jgi:hypothetical protein
MGELNCVVRFEVDAWGGGEGAEQERIEDCASGGEDTAVPPESGGSQGGEDVLTGFGELSLGEGPSPKPPVQLSSPGRKSVESKLRNQKHLSVGESAQAKKQEHFQRIRVIRRGHLVPCSALAEIKTRTRMVMLAETLPQLWFGRTPYLLHATHNDGTFAEVERINAGERFEGWEKQHQVALQKMVSLIGLLKEVAREAKNGACIVVCRKEMKPLVIEVFESTTGRAVLPEEIVKKYWREDTIPSTS